MTKNYYSSEQLWKMDRGDMTIGSDYMLDLVSEALSKVPKKVVDKIHKQCLYIEIEEDDCFLIHPSVVKGKYLIFIHSKLLDDANKAIDNILLMTAHFNLYNRDGLKDFTVSQVIEGQDIKEYEKSREEAQELVAEWLKLYADKDK